MKQENKKTYPSRGSKNQSSLTQLYLCSHFLFDNKDEKKSKKQQKKIHTQTT